MGTGAGRYVAAALALVVLPAAAPSYALSTTLLGRRLDLGGHLELRQVFETNGSTPDDDFMQQIWLDVRYELGDHLALQSTVSAQNGGPTTQSDSWNVYNVDDVFQSLSPGFDVHEVFLDIRARNADLRIGQQKFAWGRLDRFQPTDVLNTERFADPVMLDEVERKIGVPAVNGTYYLPARPWLPADGQVTLVWIPQYFPFRFPRYRERWFPPAAVPPDAFTLPLDVLPLPGGDAPTITVPLSFRTENAAPPSFRAGRSGYAARVSGYTRGVDYSVVYYHGFDSQPAFRLTAEALAGDPSDGPLGFDPLAQTTLKPIFRVVDLWGADASYAWRSFTFRAEAAFVTGRPFSRDIRFLIDDPSELADEIAAVLPELVPGGPPVPIELPPSFVERDALEWGLGADYITAGYRFIVQLNQTDVFDNDVDLLVQDVDTRLGANVQKRFWREDLEIEMSAVYAFESGYTLLLPHLTYLFRDRLECSAGYVFIAGRSSSLIGQYKRNDQGYLRLRYLF